MTAAADRAARRRLPTERFARKLDEYVPGSGELRAWTISELEQPLLADTSELARDVIESRLDIDPARVPEKPPRCPACGAALASRQVPTHRHTLFGRIRARVRALPGLRPGFFPLWTLRSPSPRAALARTTWSTSRTSRRRPRASPARLVGPRRSRTYRPGAHEVLTGGRSRYGSLGT
jgi:hypothetical protein